MSMKTWRTSTQDISQTIEGTWVINTLLDAPVPWTSRLGTTPAAGIAVYKYSYGYECELCGGVVGTSREYCQHVRAVMEINSRKENHRPGKTD